MSESVTQSPLGINVLGSLLQSIGLHVNPVLVGLIGTSVGYSSTAAYTDGGPYNPGSVIESTVLRLLTYAIHEGYIGATVDGTLSNATYNNLIMIGSGSIPAFGNSKPPTYTWDQESGSSGVGELWAPTGWGGVDQYDRVIAASNPNEITAWGFIRLLALQSQNEWNYNDNQPNYNDFLQSFLTTSSWAEMMNPTVIASNNAETFLNGVYSNMNDLITGDISGITISTFLWGQDLITLGKAFDLSSINTFGLPSNLLRTLKKNNAISNSLIVALLASGITSAGLDSILNSTVAVMAETERDIYAAYTVIMNQDLEDILIPLNCKTKNLESLADLLDPRKIFPNSYETLTVPFYNVEAGPTNSKTYYPIYVGDEVNMTLMSPTLVSKVPPEPIILSDAQNSTNNSTNSLSAAMNILREATVAPVVGSDTRIDLASYDPILNAQQSISTSVVLPISRVGVSDTAESIASGRASSPLRNE